MAKRKEKIKKNTKNTTKEKFNCFDYGKNKNKKIAQKKIA